MAKKPNIRFAGFEDDWEQRKLGEMMNITSVKRIHQSDWTDSGVRFLRARDIVAASKNEETDDYLYISEEKYEEYSALSGKVDIDDLLVTGVGTIGVPYLVENLEPLYFKDGNIIWFQNKNKIDGKFLYYSFIGNGIQSFIKASAGTGTVGTYTIDTGKKTPIQFPSKEEQKKIGEYLTNLDHLITLHQRKCDELKKVKKFMLQKMFPKKGEKNPEIRFDGFTNDWEQRKFSDVGSVAMCKRIFKEQTSDEGEVPFYKIGTFGGVPDAFISRKLFDEYKTKYPYPNKGDILISASGSIGRTVEFTGKDEYFQDSNIVWLKHGDEIDNSFLKVLYSVVEWSCEGSTIKRLYNDNFLKTNFMLPKIDEQIKLGAYFSALDHLITLHQRKCEELKNVKKYMLQNMFAK